MGGGGSVRTSGPVTWQTDRDTYTSPEASSPDRWTWTAATVIVLIEPTTSLRVCSFRVIEPTPGSVNVVLGAGFVARLGRPVTTALVSVVDADEPSPFEVQVLAMTSAVSSPASTFTSATLALDVAKPA